MGTSLSGLDEVEYETEYILWLIINLSAGNAPELIDLKWEW